MRSRTPSTVPTAPTAPTRPPTATTPTSTKPPTTTSPTTTTPTIAPPTATAPAPAATCTAGSGTRNWSASWSTAGTPPAALRAWSGTKPATPSAMPGTAPSGCGPRMVTCGVKRRWPCAHGRPRTAGPLSCRVARTERADRRFCLSADHRLVRAQERSEAVVPVYAERNAGAGFFKADPKQTAGGPNRASRRPHFNLAGLAQIDLGYLVLVILLRVDAHQHLHPGQHAVLVEPDLALVRVQAQQDELGIVLAGVPGGDERIPQPLDHRAV